jgi:protein tyrosine/serine phosphatase
MFDKSKRLLVLLMVPLVLAGCRKKPDDQSGQAQDDGYQLQVVPLELAGCSNLYKVNDRLYRGAQPEAEGFEGLKKLGVKTVVNLRSSHSDRKLLEDADLDYVHVKMQAWDAEYEEVKQALQIITDKSKQPVFVHCQHGADRTGAVVAAYRLVADGWTKEKAIEEMTKGPFGFHKIWRGLPKFIRNLDVEKLQKEVGIASQSE